MEITILGTSCMVPTKDRNHTSLFLSYKGEGILIDCGEGTQRQLKLAKIKPSKINSIFLTHWHGDHVLGLPGLLQTLNSSDYEGKLKIYGPKGTIKNFEYMFKAFLFSIGFEHEIIEIEEEKILTKNLIIESKKLEHSVLCLGYTLTEKDSRRMKVREIKKLGIPEGPLLGKLQSNQSIEWKGKTVSPKDTTYLVKGKKLSIVLDTVLCDNVNYLAKDADLLIIESSYLEEQSEKAIEYKHMTAHQAGIVASKNNVKKVVLVHLSQRYKTPEKIFNEIKIVFENSVVGYDLMKIKI